jgi:predicted GNAT superfamily acetyltransferase
VTIRELTTLAEFEACLELQRDGFGWADVDLMPVRLFVVTHHIGGLVLGAFESGRLIGFLSAIPAVRNGKPYWHSHMLAVSGKERNAGIGTLLKLEQKEQARRRGIRLIEWTFDPLESKNAYLNICKLGVIVRRFYPNLYGTTSGAAQQGLESDRVVAEWWVERPAPASGSGVRRITIPADIQALKKQDPEAARRLQQRVRDAFLQNIRDDFYAAAFERRGAESEYIFLPGAALAYPID